MNTVPSLKLPLFLGGGLCVLTLASGVWVFVQDGQKTSNSNQNLDTKINTTLTVGNNNPGASKFSSTVTQSPNFTTTIIDNPNGTTTTVTSSVTPNISSISSSSSVTPTPQTTSGITQTNVSNFTTTIQKTTAIATSTIANTVTTAITTTVQTTTAVTTTTVPPTTIVTTTVAPSTKYQNTSCPISGGINGSYSVPGGSTSIGVKITINNDKITAVTITPNASHSNESYPYQVNYASGIGGLVIGTSVDSSFNFGAVNGASLTNNGFKAAMITIRAKALRNGGTGC